MHLESMIIIKDRKFIHLHVYISTKENVLSEIQIRLRTILIQSQCLKVHVSAYFGYFDIFGIW